MITLIFGLITIAIGVALVLLPVVTEMRGIAGTILFASGQVLLLLAVGTTALGLMKLLFQFVNYLIL